MKRYLQILAVVFGTRLVRSLLFAASLSGTIQGVILHHWLLAALCAAVLIPVTIKSLSD